MNSANKRGRDPISQRVRYIGKPLTFVVCLLPLVWLALRVLGQVGPDLGANPIEALLDYFGNWALRFVLLALSVTPLRQLTGFVWLARFRRMIGLFAAFYVSLHFATYFVLDQSMQWALIVEDIIERPFITLGATAFLLLLAMAATSTMAARRAMGKRWQKLHYSLYAVGILAVWHYWWQVKKDISEPLIYAAILSVLLGLRIYWRMQRRRKAQRASLGASREPAV